MYLFGFSCDRAEQGMVVLYLCSGRKLIHDFQLFFLQKKYTYKKHL